MKRFRGIEKARLTLFLLPLLLASFIPPALALPSYLPGVKQGDSWTYGDWNISCSYFCPPDFVGQLGQIASYQILVENVTGFNVGLNQTFTYYNGSSVSTTGYANTESYGGFFLIARGLIKGDHVYNSTSAPTINDTVSQFYAGADRQVNVLNYTQYQSSGNATFAYFWDQPTGILLQISEVFSFPNPNGPNGSIILDVRMTSTNLWTPTLPDFTLSSTPLSPTTLKAGGSATATITLTSLQSFSGPVTVSATVTQSIPDHPVSIANPPTVTLTAGGTGHSALTVTTTTSTTPGVYNVVIIANYTKTVVHFTTLDLTVTGPDFSISANPSSLTIPSGGTNFSTITVQSLQGFTGTVALSLQPSNLQLSLSSYSVDLTAGSAANSTLTITVPPGTNYYGSFTVTGSSGFLYHQVQGSVYITPAAPPNINITASPSTLNLSSGTTGISIVTVTSVRGFTGTVDLHSFIYSDGVGEFGELNVTSVTLTPTATSAHAVLAIPYPGTGVVHVLVQATGPGVFKEFNLTVTGTPPGPDFSVNASQTGFDVTPGGAFSTTLTLASFNSYADSIQIVQQPFTTGCQPTVSSGGGPILLRADGSNATTIGFTVPDCAPQGFQNFDLTLTGTRVPAYHQYFFGYNVRGNSTLPDFTLVPTTPSAINVPQGSVANVTVTVRSVNGFSGKVNLVDLTGSELILPDTVTLTPGGAENVTLTQLVYTNQQLGSYSYPILATSGSISHASTVSLNVIAGTAPSFSITGSTYYINLLAGQPATETLTVKSLNNFSGTIDLTSIFDSQQLTVSFNQTSVAISPTRTAFVQMTIDGASSVSAGNWYLEVVGHSGSLSAAAAFEVDLTSTTAPDFSVTFSPPGTLNFNGASIGSVNVEFKSLNGFTGTIQLVPSIYNFFSTVLFSSNQVFLSAGADVNVTMYVTPIDFTAASNNYARFSAVSGTTVQFGILQIYTPSPPDFVILQATVSPALSFAAGSSASWPMIFYAVGGFTSPINLSVNSYPTGLNLHLNATTVTPRPTGYAAANLTITGAIPGSYIVVITATSGVLVRSQILVVNVNTVPDFNMTASPSSLNIPQGSTSTTKITVKSLNGFSGRVSLNALATNFQLSLSAPSVTLTAGGNANVTLTIPIPINAPTGLFQFEVSGNTTSYSASLIVPVTITAELHSFNVTANPTLLTFLVGAQATSIITVTANNGFTATVNLGNNTSTPLATCSLSPTSITLTSTATSGTSTLTCIASAPGTYYVTVKGDSGAERHVTNVTIFVPRIAYVPGVSVGNTFTLQKLSVTWTSSIPASIFPEPSFLTLLNDTDHIDILVTAVSGTNVTIRQTWVYSNSTPPAVGYITVNLATGAFNTTGVLPSSPSNGILAKGLQALDHIYADPFSPTINMTATRNLLGSTRTVNFLNMTMTNPYGSFSSQTEWDQASGITVGASANIIVNGGPLGNAKGGFVAALTQTNIWTSSNKPVPTITSTTPNPANTGQQVTVSFTVSSATTVTAVTVNWGDGTTDALGGTATSDTYSYASTGTHTSQTFTINVTATNSAGSGSGTTTETVKDRPPAVTISTILPNPATTSQIVTATFSATDPDGTIASYTVNWGDASTSNSLPGTATSDTHSYSSAGPFTITVKATDNSGSTGQNTGSVSVQGPLAPTVTIGNVAPNPAYTGATVTVTFSVSSTTTVIGITVNWGDGSTPDKLPGSATSDTHSYSSTANAKSQSFTITVNATNSAGTGSKTATETINDRPPTVTVSNVSPNPASTGQTVTVAFSASDPDGTIASFSVNWGDGNTDTVISGTATSDTHHYGNAGSFIVTVTATDNSGSTGTNSKSMTVNGPGKTTASLSVSCSLNSIASGASTSCTVTVTGSSIYPPSGVVTLSTNSTTGAFTPSTGTCSLNTSGTCSVTYTDTATSSRTALISAAYPGDTYNTGATGGFSLKVVKQSTGLTTASLTVVCSASTIQVGSFTTCTLSVTGSTPTGSATLSTNSGTGYFTPSNGQCTLASGSCAVTYTDTANGNVTIRIYAQYAGDTYNTVAYTNFTLTLVKPSTTLATATTPVTITSGTATADQTATTGISVQITGSTATNGTPAAISTKDLSAPSIGIGTVSLSGAKYYDVLVTGTTSGNAKVCINYASASSTTTMQYWSGTAWTDATGVSVSGGTVCGLIPVSALTGTNIAVGNEVQPAPTTPPPNNSNLLLIIAIVVAVVVIVAVAAVFLNRKGRTTQASRTTQP